MLMQILIFGSSSVYGAWDTKGGWVQRLREYYDKKYEDRPDYYVLFYNLGINGETSEGLLKRFDSETRPRTWPGDETIIIIQAGLNDSSFRPSKNSNWVSKDDYRKNLTEIVRLAKGITGKVILMNGGVFDESNHTDLDYQPDYVHHDKSLAEYNEVTKEVAKQSGVHLIDISKKLRKYDVKSIIMDGVHMNAKGHAIVFRAVRSYLEKNGILGEQNIFAKKKA